MTDHAKDKSLGPGTENTGTLYKAELHQHDTEILCITLTVEHNYISPSSTVGIQLHVLALYVGHLSGCDLTYRAAIQDVWGVF